MSSYVTRNASNIPLFNIRHIKVISFRQRSLSGITWALIFEIQKFLVFTKIIFLNLLDQNQIVFLTALNLRRLD